MNSIDRRSFLQKAGLASAGAGAVWVAPSVLGSTSAFAASSPATCPTNASLAFVAGKATTSPPGWPTGDGNGINTNAVANNGWAFTAASMSGDHALGVFAGYHAPPPNVPQFVVERNPSTTNISSAKVTYTHTLGPLSTTTAYTFSSQIFSVLTNQYTQLLDVQILNSAGTVVATLGRYRTDSSTPANNSAYTLLPSAWTTYSWNFTPATAGTYQFRFSFAFTTAGSGANTGNNNGAGDDIAVTAPTVVCA